MEMDAWAYDQPTSLSQEFRRKVRTLAGIYQILYILPGVWMPSTGVAMHFWIHKMGRLAAPFLLITIVGSCIALVPDPIAVWCLIGQAIAVGLAVADPLIAEWSRFKRLSSALRAFATMQIATVAAASILVRPAASFWRDVHQTGRSD